MAPAPAAVAQEKSPIASQAPILEAMVELESASDAKCNSTASRFEDFLFGTPLSAAARDRKIGLQKRWILDLWERASRAVGAAGRDSVTADDIAAVIDSALRVAAAADGSIRVGLADGGSVEIPEARLRQYSSIAFSLRALLAVQQDVLISGGPLLAPLESAAVDRLTAALDAHTVAALRLADEEARLLDVRELSLELLSSAWDLLAVESGDSRPIQESAAASPAPGAARGILSELIRGKLAAYEAYNEIDNADRMKLLVRNVERFYALYPIAQTPGDLATFLTGYQSLLDRFALDVLRFSAEDAREEGQALIRASQASRAAQRMTPHRFDDFEDVHFFSNLAGDRRITLESYDTDSFRDLGLHWLTLGRAYEILGDEFAALDPFAAEIVSEAISQYGVLVLRLAGHSARSAGRAPHLRADDLGWAAEEVADRAERHHHAERPAEPLDTIASAPQHESATDVLFVDASAAAGLDFAHRSSRWLGEFRRSRLSGPPTFSGGGVAADDVNGDGLPDVVLVGGRGNSLFLNRGGRFERLPLGEAIAGAGIVGGRSGGSAGEARQPLLVDFDNDGDQDLLITYTDDPHRLYRNDGAGRFEDVTATAGLGGSGLVGGPATAFDFDGDGLLDLYIGYFGDYLNGVLPLHDRDSRNGLANRLFRNLGGLRFLDVSAESGDAADIGWAQALTHTDFDRDGLQDLIVANDYGRNAFLRNLGNGRFENLAPALGLDQAYHSMNVGIADLNGDDRPDVYVSNIATMVKDNKYVLPDPGKPLSFDYDAMASMLVQESNTLYLSRLEGGLLVSYELSSDVERGATSTGWAWDAEFLDVDHDGDDDLYVVNGANEYNVLMSMYYEALDGQGGSRFHQLNYDRESNVLYLNEGGKLRNRSRGSGADFLGNSRSTAYLDYDADGDLDIAVNNFHASATLLRNDAAKHGGWLKISLVGDPLRGVSRDAIGARLIARSADGLRAYREVQGGSGYLSMNPKQQHFGTGTSESVDLEILWPDGETQVVTDLGVDASYRISLGAATVERIGR